MATVSRPPLTEENLTSVLRQCKGGSVNELVAPRFGFGSMRYLHNSPEGKRINSPRIVADIREKLLADALIESKFNAREAKRLLCLPVEDGNALAIFAHFAGKRFSEIFNA